MNVKRAKTGEHVIGHAKRDIKAGEYITMIWDITNGIWTSPDIEFIDCRHGPFEILKWIKENNEKT